MSAHLPLLRGKRHSHHNLSGIEGISGHYNIWPRLRLLAPASFAGKHLNPENIPLIDQCVPPFASGFRADPILKSRVPRPMQMS